MSHPLPRSPDQVALRGDPGFDLTSNEAHWYRQLFEHSLDGILLTSPDGGIHYANPAICRLLGYAEEELRALGRDGVVDHTDPRLQAAIDRRRETGAFAGELTFIARDGRRVAVEISSFVFTNADGRQFTSMFVRDIGERARTAEQLRQSEERFRIALKDSRITVANVDLDGRFTWTYNPRVLFGRDDVIGTSDAELAPGRWTELTELRRDVVANGVGVRRTIGVTVDDTERFYDVTAEPLRNLQSAVVGATLAATDITESKRAEARQRFLAEASEELSSSLDYTQTLSHIVHLAVPRFADLSIIDLYHDDRIEQVALAHRDPIHEAIVREIRQRFPAVSAPESHPLRQVHATGRPILIRQLTPEIIESLTRSDDHRRIVAKLGLQSAMLVPLQTHEDALGVMSFYTTGHAFTDDDLALASELARHAALAIANAHLYDTVKRATMAREEVLSVVSHDLRNPLGAVAMCATRLLNHPPESAEARHRIYSTINDAVQWMYRLMQDLLDAGAIEAGRLSIEIERASLAGIVEGAIAQFAPHAEQRSIDLHAELGSALPAVHVDASRILQVLGNLIGNALKFTPAGGSVVVRAAAREDDVLVTVTDTGAGIDAVHLPHIFDRYWQARRGSGTRGTGLGLAIAKGIVEAHGGRLWAESVVGSGSTFSFTVPTKRGPDRQR